jgi:hypothetical protein
MSVAVITNVREDLIEVFIAGAAVLGGVMAFCSGLAAADSALAGDRPRSLADRVNRGLAEGFLIGLPIAAIAATILAATRCFDLSTT